MVLVKSKNQKWALWLRWCPGEPDNPLSFEVWTPWFLFNPLLFVGRRGEENTGRRFGAHLYITSDF